MKQKIITFFLIIFVCMFFFTACQPIGAFSPTYAITSFSPNSLVHWHCAYEDGVYYYFDYDYSSAAIYKIENDSEDSLIYTSYLTPRMAVMNSMLYFANGQINSVDLLSNEEQKSMNTGYYWFLFNKDEKTIIAVYGNKKTDRIPIDDITSVPVDIFSSIPSPSISDKIGDYSIVSDDLYDYVSWYNPRYQNDIVEGIRNKKTGEIVYREVSEMYDDSLLYMTSDEMILITRSSKNGGTSDWLTKYSKENGIETLLVLPDDYYFYPNNVIQEDDKLIALVQKNDFLSVLGNYNLPRYYHYEDALITIDIETGEYEYLYKTIGKNDRIVGYAGDYVYLFKKGRGPYIFSKNPLDAIYRVGLITDEEELISTFAEKNNDYTFELCGEKIFVWGDHNSFVGAYDLY